MGWVDTDDSDDFEPRTLAELQNSWPAGRRDEALARLRATRAYGGRDALEDLDEDGHDLDHTPNNFTMDDLPEELQICVHRGGWSGRRADGSGPAQNWWMRNRDRRRGQ